MPEQAQDTTAKIAASTHALVYREIRVTNAACHTGKRQPIGIRPTHTTTL
jgi:hypothetical protein